MKEALVVVDMLNDFVLEGAPLEVPQARVIVASLKKRIDEARTKGVPVIYVCDSHDEDDREFKIWPKHCVEGTKGAEVVEDLKPQIGEAVLKKKRYSGFFETHLDKVLQEKGIDSLTITGTLTNICVLYTAADASMRGFQVTIPKDSIAALNDEDHHFALRQMEEVMKAKII